MANRHWRNSEADIFWLSAEDENEQPRHLMLQSFGKTWECIMRKDSPAQTKARRGKLRAETPEEAKRKAEALAVSWGCRLP